MSKLIRSLLNISDLEALARRENWLNATHGLAKLLVTVVYIICVASVNKYDLQKVILFMVYPVFLFTAIDIPVKVFLKKMILPIGLGASLGILNPLLDKNLLMLTHSFTVSAGWLSLLVLFIKSSLSISAAFLLVATTPIEEIVGGLRKLKFPKLMAVQLLIMFRYITIMIEEFERALTAYSLRAQGRRALEWKSWGSFMGQIFIRSSKRSYRLYESMKLRGFNGSFDHVFSRKVGLIDAGYFFTWTGLLVIILV